ncbi:PAS domain S-box protein [Nostoc sp. TCL26-01]|uniref:hybrid sensor histidine kinase/response regulator n=1 Tax=Nostoc sp. TCL26-01 TaxID=2576904 RepID=UPI0015B8B93A|nr:PAS domain S-box protein [Nostoc sp. TCL26-01]QLE58012.1 PAS domain S-box protein [Nostoc sp. TCL26-01]
MLETQRSYWQSCSISLVSVLLALLVGLALEIFFKLKVEVSLLFLASVVVSSWYGGIVPGLLAIVLAIVVKDYFFTSPVYSIALSNWTDLIHPVMFSLVGGLVSFSNAHLRTTSQVSIAKLAKLKINYRCLLETVNEGIWIFDTLGQTEYVNHRIADKLGYSVEEILQRSLFDLIELENQQDFWQWIAQEHEQSQECHLYCRDGSLWWVIVSISPIWNQQGEVSGAIAILTDITERKQSENNSDSERLRLQTILDTLPVGILIADSQGKLLEMNPAMKAIWGQDAPLLNHTSQYHQYRGWWADTGKAIAADEWTLARTLASGEAILDEEINIETFDGKRKTILNSAIPIDDEHGTMINAVVVNVDISERKQAEAALQESELKFRSLADTMPQMFWITRPDGYHEYFNQRWYDYTGTSLEQTQGEGWQNILHPDDVERTIVVWQDCLETGNDYEIEYRFRRASDGEYRWQLGRAFPLRNQDGSIIKWFGSCTDIHEQKLAIEERAQALERERTARIELERAIRMKDDFLAIVSHELRSPLNPILGWAKLLKSRKLDTNKINQALEVIERNAQLQARLIDDLLDVSRILRGKLSLNACTLDLANTIEAALETVRLTAEAKSIQIHTEYTPHVGKVKGDPNRLQQVVWNLLSNAVKFTPEAGQIKVSLKKVGSLAQIQVSDNGKGISQDFLPYVFERFRQADETTTRKFGGLGLGLAIVRHLVELHGGSVQVSSEGEDLGATFTVQIPLITVTPGSEDDFTPDIEPNLQGLRLVVVDDDADTLELLTFILEQQGVEVKAVSSATEALKAITQTQPDLLLSDIGMPEVDGYMLIQRLRTMETSTTKKLPAIALTAFAGEADSQRIISSGFQYHLTKPVEPSELAKVIANLVMSSE